MKILIPLFFLLVLLILSLNTYADVATYNYSAQTNIQAFCSANCYADSAPPDNGPFVTCGTVSNCTTDTDFDESDDNRQNIIDGGFHDWQLFIVDVQETVADITKLNWTWEGSLNSNQDEVYLYLWDDNGGSWLARDSTSSTTDVVLNSTITTNIANYINSTGHTHLIAHTNANDGWTGGRTDYVRLDITYTSGTCTPPAAGDYTVDATDNCDWTAADDIPGNVYISGDGIVTLSAKWTFTGSDQIIAVSDGAEFHITSGGSFN